MCVAAFVDDDVSIELVCCVVLRLVGDCWFVFVDSFFAVGLSVFGKKSPNVTFFARSINSRIRHPLGHFDESNSCSNVSKLSTPILYDIKSKSHAFSSLTMSGFKVILSVESMSNCFSINNFSSVNGIFPGTLPTT